MIMQHPACPASYRTRFRVAGGRRALCAGRAARDAIRDARTHGGALGALRRAWGLGVHGSAVYAPRFDQAEPRCVNRGAGVACAV